MRGWVRLALIVGAVVVVVAVVSSWSGGGSDELEFVAPAQETAVVDNGPEGVSLGDSTVVSGVLLDPDGDEAGRHDGVCTITSRPDVADERRMRCAVTLTVGTDDGETELQLAAVGREQADDVAFSVIGGSGKYQGAGGEAVFDYAEDRDRPRITVDLDD
jgi:hypothetical protein